MNKNFNSLPITAKNTFTFSKNTFDLSHLYENLNIFYNNVGLEGDIYYAHVFNKEGLLCNPQLICGFKVNKIDYSSFFSFFSDKDITFATDMENNEFYNYFKQNVLIIKTI